MNTSSTLPPWHRRNPGALPINVPYALARHPMRNDPIWGIRIPSLAVAQNGGLRPGAPLWIYISGQGNYQFSGPPQNMYPLRLAVEHYHERLERNQDPEICRSCPGTVNLSPIIIGEPYSLEAREDRTYNPPNPFGWAYLKGAILPEPIAKYADAYKRLVQEQLDQALH